MLNNTRKFGLQHRRLFCLKKLGENEVLHSIVMLTQIRRIVLASEAIPLSLWRGAGGEVWIASLERTEPTAINDGINRYQLRLYEQSNPFPGLTNKLVTSKLSFPSLFLANRTVTELRL